jgi:hypothetical protein
VTETWPAAVRIARKSEVAQLARVGAWVVEDLGKLLANV